MAERDGFIKGAAVLALAGLVSKLMGAAYRIPFARIVGAEAMGIYQMAYPIYTIVLALSTAGVPVAISILVSEKISKGDTYGAKRVFKMSLTLLAFVGLFFSMALVVGADVLTQQVLREPRALPAVQAIAPAIFITSVMSAIRGYFQGQQIMYPTAISQIIEQFVRVSTVFLGVWLFNKNIALVAAGATFGAVTGSGAGLFFLAYYLLRTKNNRPAAKPSYPQERKRSLVKRIVIIALPLSLGNLIMPIMHLIDAAVVPRALQAAGYGVTRSTELFGQFTGMAGTLVNLPTIITLSLAVSLVPAVAESVSEGSIDTVTRRINAALRVSIILMLPAAAGLWVLAQPISVFLFDIREVSVSLSFLAWGVIFLGLYQVTAGALQGMSKPVIPVINLIAGAVVKLFVSLWLTAIPAAGIRGAAIATVLGFITASGLNYLSLKRIVGGLNISSHLLKPLLAVIIMITTSAMAYARFSSAWGNSIGVLLAVILAAVVYIFSLVLLGAVEPRDVRMIPLVGVKLAAILTKLGLRGGK